MSRRLQDFRLIPVVLIATICLFALKTFGLVFDGGYLLGDLSRRTADETDITGTITVPKADAGPVATLPAAKPQPPVTPPPKPKSTPSWAQQMFNFPDVTGSTGETKSAPAEAPAAKEAKPKAAPKDAPPGAGWTPIAVDPGRASSPAERAILERLAERRTELDARAKDLDLRDSLLKAAERRLEARVAELKQLEQRVNAAAQAKDEAEAARFKNVITIYENMKAKDAAKIFERLDLKVLVDVSTKINPRRMSDILAQMSPDAAERLTVELASRKDKAKPAELPKIEGHLTAN